MEKDSKQSDLDEAEEDPTMERGTQGTVKEGSSAEEKPVAKGRHSQSHKWSPNIQEQCIPNLPLTEGP